MVTPLAGQDVLDVEGLERLVEHLLAGGVHGLFLLGTTGEGPSLSYKVRMELIERVSAQVNGRVPILVGITDTSFAESIDLAQCACDEGASAVVLAAPYYFPARQEDLLRYVQHIVAQLPLPVFLYNMPSHTKLAFELDTVKQAMQIPNVIGMKDSSGLFVYFQAVQQAIQQRPDFTLLVGPEEMLGATVLFGGHGGVPGGGNLFPRLYVELFEAATAGDLETVRRLHAQTIRISTKLYTVGNYGTGITRAIKSALSSLGICSPTMAEPFQALDTAERHRVRQVLDELASHEPEICALKTP
jgi:dihydrodipicolinate synthase/N-acetylneuraminate lyase